MDSVSSFHFSTKTLDELGSRLAPTYQQNQPFPHVTFDGILPTDLLRQVVSEIPTQRPELEKKVYHTHGKAQFNPANTPDLGPTIRNVLNELNSHPFLLFLEKLTGITGLVPDPYFLGGGIHQISSGGFLKVHADFNWHKQLKLDRRINLLLYLNEDWRPEWGGNLELWDENMLHCQHAIEPIFNRMVVFSTTDSSYHGHPDPLRCPEGVFRRSIALYYYTNGRPRYERKKGKHLHTLYQERPNEQVFKNRSRRFLARLIPAFIYELRDRFASKNP